TGGQDRFERGDTSLTHYSLTKRKEDSLVEKVDGFELSRDGKRVLMKMKDSFSISDVGEKIDPAKHKLAIENIEVKIDPVAEWRQIFDEAWRINRDYFYDPHMHGNDWPAVRKKYAAFLPHLATRADLSRVLQGMLSELAVGHSTLVPGERLHARKTVPGRLL